MASMNMSEFSSREYENVNEHASELTKRIETARSATQESIEICQDIFINSQINNEEEIDTWFNKVTEPLVEALDLFCTSLKAYQDYLQLQDETYHENKESSQDNLNKKVANCSVKLENIEVKQEEDIQLAENEISEEECIKSEPVIANYSSEREDFEDFDEDERPYSCKFCIKAFKNNYKFKIHMRRHTGDKPYKCYPCKMAFVSSTALARHKKSLTHVNIINSPSKPKTLQIKIKDNDNNIDENTNVDEKKEEPEFIIKGGTDFIKLREPGVGRSRRNKSYSCMFCEQIFNKKGSLKEHERTVHTEITCSQCEPKKIFSNIRYYKKHQQVHKDKTFMCKECGRLCPTAASLKTHEMIHTGEKPFSCNTCGESFRRIEYLNRHKKMHSDERPFTCNICGHSFKVKTGLTRHLRLHLDEWPFPCDVCDKAFKSGSKLRIHKRRHTGDKPYKCDPCNIAFVSSTALVRHKKCQAHLNMTKSSFVDNF